MKNTASSLLFEVLTVVTYCSSNLPWGQNILLTWRLLPIKRLVKCRADIEGNTSPAFKGQFFLEVSRRFRIVHQMVPSMDTSISERHVFFWMKNFQSCFGNEMGPPQKTTTRYAQWSLNNIPQRLERLQWFLCTWHLEKTPVKWDGVCWFYKIKFHWIRHPQLRLAHSDPRLNTHTHTHTHCSRHNRQKPPNFKTERHFVTFASFCYVSFWSQSTSKKFEFFFVQNPSSTGSGLEFPTALE